LNTLILITAAAVCNSLALTLLKITGDKLRITPGFLEVLRSSWLIVLLSTVLYAVSFLLTIKVFSGSTFSRAVPTYVGINIMSTLLIAVLYFRESASFSLAFGSALIIAGVWLIQTSTT